MTRPLTPAILALMILCCGMPVSAQEPAEVMTAENLRQRVVEAVGGAEALAAIDRLEITGRYATNSRYVDQRILRQRPNRYLLERGSWRKGRASEVASRGFDGDKTWAFDPTADPPGHQPVDDDRKISLLAEARFIDALLELPDGTGLELIGLEQTELGELWRLRLTPTLGPAEDWLIDPNSFLPAALYTDRWDWGRQREIRFYFDDWREVGKVLWPFAIEDEFSSFHRSLKIDSIRIDPKLPKDAFAAPAPTPTGGAPR